MAPAPILQHESYKQASIVQTRILGLPYAAYTCLGSKVLGGMNCWFSHSGQCRHTFSGGGTDRTAPGGTGRHRTAPGGTASGTGRHWMCICNGHVTAHTC